MTECVVRFTTTHHVDGFIPGYFLGLVIGAIVCAFVLWATGRISN